MLHGYIRSTLTVAFLLQTFHSLTADRFAWRPVATAERLKAIDDDDDDDEDDVDSAERRQVTNCSTR